jgi:hypothetical protein
MKLTAGVLLLTLCVPMFAHHGTFTSYERDKTITMKATVTRWEFAYPHPLLYFDVKDQAGNTVHWAAEMIESPGILKNKDARWNRNSLKKGDELTIVCNPHKSLDAKVCRAAELTVNNKKIY